MHVILYNPRSTSPGKQPLPLSVLSLAAVLEGHEWSLVDGNLDADPTATILALIRGCRPESGPALAVTVMPGPQVVEAVNVCRRVRRAAPQVPIVWGGYFPTVHTDTVLAAPYVDFVVRSQGEAAVLDLLSVLSDGGAPERVPNLSWKRGTTIVHNALGEPWSPDDLPWLPYSRVGMEHYIHSNYLGQRTALYNSSFGCPFACSFCAVVSMSHRRWLAQSPERVTNELAHLVGEYSINGVQMTDMDFFISEDRVTDIAERVAPLRLSWWAMGRIDILSRYTTRTWNALKRSGLRMIFMGAESGSDAVLSRMNKGGRASPSLTLDLAAALRRWDIVPEFSFVVGSPPDPLADMEQTFSFIRRLKAVNPSAEIVIYVYTPVPADGDLYDSARRAGFQFPVTLDEWATDAWRQLTLRRGEGLPWMPPRFLKTARGFERVLNAYYPTVTDQRLTAARRRLLRTASAWRYWTGFYSGALELRALQYLMQYRRPETTGF